MRQPSFWLFALCYSPIDSRRRAANINTYGASPLHRKPSFHSKSSSTPSHQNQTGNRGPSIFGTFPQPPLSSYPPPPPNISVDPKSPTPPVTQTHNPAPHKPNLTDLNPSPPPQNTLQTTPLTSQTPVIFNHDISPPHATPPPHINQA
ncbi:hypothetical protein Salat_2427800 [Sesamum alatum]|uniref:Uncharacterized protein n=1 Tax=Sesamum alatum TaxID=300844 RepID=A0AAE1XYU3_9LAMI|nr:hypothetical protein Salat_2427800 [Sesamum alatum]